MHSLVLVSAFHQHILYAAFALWIIPEWIGSHLQRPEKGAARRDRGSYAVLTLGLGVGIVGAFACTRVDAATLGWHQPILFWAGIALMLAGTAFRWYAIRALGRYFTREVATREGQTVIEHGPYRLIRHPSYSGVLVTVLGIGLALTNWLSLLVVLACTFAGFSYRVRVEERALCEAIGRPYREYMRRTRRFIPHIW
ncbi:MAG TPA: isoprenylcysteine carboxylmethyltransferase family protein [Gammaproteobacteria bacterium]|nr:isoprenylcysteine carboxylmethyltransferase family protein [Gammaproteobacteria bacterium]